MVLVDTSIWIDHLHRSEPELVSLLASSEVCTHVMVIGELAVGSLRDRDQVLALLVALPQIPSATHDEVLALVTARSLFGIGLSLVDAHLLASALITPATKIWSLDRRLRDAADELGLSAKRP